MSRTTAAILRCRRPHWFLASRQTCRTTDVCDEFEQADHSQDCQTKLDITADVTIRLQNLENEDIDLRKRKVNYRLQSSCQSGHQIATIQLELKQFVTDLSHFSVPRLAAHFPVLRLSSPAERLRVKDRHSPAEFGLFELSRNSKYENNQLFCRIDNVNTRFRCGFIFTRRTRSLHNAATAFPNGAVAPGSNS